MLSILYDFFVYLGSSVKELPRCAMRSIARRRDFFGCRNCGILGSFRCPFFAEVIL